MSGDKPKTGFVEKVRNDAPQQASRASANKQDAAKRN